MVLRVKLGAGKPFLKDEEKADEQKQLLIEQLKEYSFYSLSKISF